MNDLLKRVVDSIEKRKAEILDSADFLLKNPECGYKEFKAAEFVEKEFEKLGLQVKSNLAITGVRADTDSGRPGPKIAIMGELDALPVPSHPFADPVTGAAHACGHHAQVAMMLAAAAALVPVIKELSGSLAFIAVPAEEFQSLEYCRELIAEKKISYCGGKAEFIKIGVLDDIDAVLLIHAGINAASMARQALNMIDAQRDTFNDKDSVRIHGIISDGGSAVNVVPDRAELELQIRAKTPEAVRDACSKVDRCVKAAAMAFGGRVNINNLGGYMPYRSCAELNQIHAESLAELDGGVLGNCGHRGSSTDMGDVSMLIPALHAYSGGFSGSPHAKNFVVVDPEKAYIQGAKLLAMDAVKLLENNAALGNMIASIKPFMTKEEYINYKELFCSTEEFNYDQA